MKRCILALWLVFYLCVPVRAQTETLYAEQLQASGADRLTDQLPEDAQALLEELGLDDLQPESYTALRLKDLLEGLGTLLSRQSAGPLAALTTLVAVVAMSALFGQLEGTAASPSLRQTYLGVTTLAAGGALLVPLMTLMNRVAAAVDSVAVFMGAYVPVYAGVMAAGGGSAGALSYQTTLLVAVELLTWLCRSVVMPLLVTSLALGCTGAVTEDFGLDRVSATIHKTILWGLGLLSTLFSGLLSLQQMVAAAGDTLGRRAIKFSLASLVPVVGGLMSEAFSTVLGCAGLLRSTVGVFGLVATVAIVVPVLLACVVWSVGLSLAGTAAALFRLPHLERLCRAAAGAVRVMIGVLAVFALLMLVSTTVVAFAVKGG